MDIIDTNIGKIKSLCNEYKVANLFVFGSMLTDTTKRDSDIDFLVNFSEVDVYEYAGNCFCLKEALEQLPGRPIDLHEEKAIRNPYLKNSIDALKQLIYG